MDDREEPAGVCQDRPGGVFRVWEPTPELRFLQQMACAVSRLQQKWCHTRSGREEWRDVPVVLEELKGNPLA